MQLHNNIMKNKIIKIYIIIIIEILYIVYNNIFK